MSHATLLTLQSQPLQASTSALLGLNKPSPLLETTFFSLSKTLPTKSSRSDSTGAPDMLISPRCLHGLAATQDRGHALNESQTGAAKALRDSDFSSRPRGALHVRHRV